ATLIDNSQISATTSPIKVDNEPPTGIGAAPARSADANGWYRNPVTINWSGSDATSGIASCTSLSYSGPDGSSIAPSGSCTDQAGNTSSPLTLGNPIKYDSTAPTAVQGTAARGPDHNGWYSKPV